MEGNYRSWKLHIECYGIIRRKSDGLVAVPSSLKKRLKDLEWKLYGRDTVKVFIYRLGENTPYWTPELHDTWKNADPNRHAVLLQVRNCGVK